jgi:iron complex outermembrane receptor protein
MRIWSYGLAFFITTLASGEMAAAATAAAEPAESNAENNNDSGGLQEVVVTARHVTEALQTVPISDSVFTPQLLQDTGTRDTRDLQFATPSLSIGEQVGAPAAAIISLRGQVQTDAEITVDPSVGVYVDDVYLGRSNGQISELFDIEQIEVLKGPQGTLYGRNTTGGALKITSKQADPSAGWNGYVSGGGGNYHSYDANGGLNIPIIPDKLAVRVALLDRSHSGYSRTYVTTDTPFPTLTGRTIETDNNHFLGYRINATLSVSDALNFKFGYDNAVIRTSGQLAKNKYGDLFNPLTFSFSDSPEYLSDFHAGRNNEFPYADQSSHGLSLVGDLTVAGVDAKLILAHRTVHATQGSDIDGADSEIIAYNYILGVKQDSAELRLSGKVFDDRLQWLFGGYWFQEKGFESTLSPNEFFGLESTLFASNDRNRSSASFINFQYKITDPLSVFGGYRYTWDNKTTEGLNRQQIPQISPDFTCAFVPGTPGLVINSPTDCHLNRGGSWGFGSWAFGVNYQLTPDMFTYVKTDRATRSGGQQDRGIGYDPGAPNAFTGGVGVDTSAPFEPETVTDVEVGIKSELLDRHIRINADYYHSWYKNQQAEIITVVPAFNTSTTVIYNLKGTTTFDGVELDTAAKFGGFGLNMVGSYINWHEAQPNLFNPAMTPRFKFSVTPSYTVPAPYGTYRLNVSYSYTGLQFAQATKSIESALTMDAYRLVNADLSLELNNPNLTIDLWGKNILNEKYIAFSTAFSPGPAFVIAPQYLGAPATFGAQVTWKF